MPTAKEQRFSILSVVLSAVLVVSGVPAGIAHADEPIDKDEPSQQEPPAPVSIAGAVISGVDKAYGQTGKAIKPALKVVLNGKELEAKADYRVTYKNNVKRGTATMTIEGIGDYTGKVTKKFKIQYRIKYVLNGGGEQQEEPEQLCGQGKERRDGKARKTQARGL